MTSPDLVRGLAFTTRLSWRSYRVLYPLRVLLLSTLPRAVLQVLFFAFLGRVTGGVAGGTFAFVGASVHICVLSTVIKGNDVLVDERQHGTMYRSRLGVVPLPLLVSTRWIVYAAEGVLASVTAAVVAGALLGQWPTAAGVLMATPLLVLVNLTTSAFGMMVSIASTTGRTDLLWMNMASYGLLVLCGAVAPVSALGWVGATVSQILPITHGLAAVRAALAGQPWFGQAVAELVVGAAWLLVAVGLLTVQDRRARRHGTDDIF